MQLIMVPGSCSNEYQRTGGSFCESCFARALVRGSEAELACIAAVRDDGAAATTLTMRYGGHEQAIQLTDDERERLAYGGWHGWEAYVEQLTP
jgi:hypothetical protein